jgi:hypothetical protein
MKQVNCNFELNITTEDSDKLPNPRQMKHDLEELFSAALDEYLDKIKVEGEEVHFILGDDLTIEDLG